MKEFLKHLFGFKDPTPEEQFEHSLDIMQKISPEMKQKEKKKEKEKEKEEEEEEEEEKDSEDENSEEK